MATERQVVSVSLTQQQSDFIKNRPEGQSAYIQTLIDNQMNLPTNMQPDIPVIPISLEHFIIDNLDPNLVVRNDCDDVSACNRFHIGENHNDMTLTICQMVDKGFVTSWLTCRLRHYGHLPNNRYILDIDLLSRFRPNCQPFSFETRSDLLTYQLGNESNLVKAFLDTAERLFPKKTESGQTNPDLDSLPNAIYNNRFVVSFFSPIKNSPWNLPELPYYVNRVEFNKDEIKIAFLDNESFALHKFMKKLYGLVSIDITTVKYDDGSDIETTRYNCCVSTTKPPYRTTLVYNSKADICKTTVQFIVLQQDDVNKLNQWPLYLAEYAINDKQFLSNPALLTHFGLGEKPEDDSMYYSFSDADKRLLTITINNSDHDKSFVIHNQQDTERYKATFVLSDREYLHISVIDINDPISVQPITVVKTSWTTTLDENDVAKHQTWWNGDDIKWLTDILDSYNISYPVQLCINRFFDHLDEASNLGSRYSPDVQMAMLVEDYVKAAKAMYGKAVRGCGVIVDDTKTFTMRTSQGSVSFTKKGETIPTSFKLTMKPHESGKFAVRVESYGTKYVHPTVIMDKEMADNIATLFDNNDEKTPQQFLDIPLVLYTASASLVDLKEKKTISDTEAEYLRKLVLANRLAVIAIIYDQEGKKFLILTPEKCSPAIDQNGNPVLMYKGLDTTIYYKPSDIVVLVPDYDRQSVVALNTFPTNIARHQDQSGVFYTYTTACTTT